MKRKRGDKIHDSRAIFKNSKEYKEVWPEHFNVLYKVFKAMNTVLGFLSSRKRLPTTFSTIRSSVEALLQHPLELASVAELKALLPDMVKFSYIPKNDLCLHEQYAPSKYTDLHKEASHFSTSKGLQRIGEDDCEGDHVLVLELVESSKGSMERAQNTSNTSASAVTRLIEKRNKRFQEAVDEFIRATPPTSDSVTLLQIASHTYIPLKPRASTSTHTILPGSSVHPDIQGVAEPRGRPPVHAVITEIRQQSWYRDQIVEMRTFEAKEGRIGTLDPPLSESIITALQNFRDISKLYTHQTSAIRAIADGKNVIVSTGTASGKTVVYQVPVLRFLEGDHSATAVFIYPTKALAQDQKAAMEQLIHCCPGMQHLKVFTYDGDTPQEHRAEIRASASVIFTNFDMIHTSILPHEELWRRFLQNIKLLVVDELHYYSGLLGSHVAQVMRRFRRVCAAVGNRHIIFVSCSATISKPMVHMRNIFGVELEDIESVVEDGSPSARKDFLVWNPPFVDPQVPSFGRRSSLAEATGLMRFLMKRGLRVILFCKIRKICELAMKTIRADLTNEGCHDILNRTMPYRGGYSPEDRRRIEKDAFEGRLLGIISTNALELGVDIGALDAVIMLGFPTTIASFRQQAGRAGRRSRDSLAVFVADSFPVDQHYVNNPQELFENISDDLIIDLESDIILEAHLQCASYEMPLSVDDEKYFGPLMKKICETRLVKDQDGWYLTHPRFLPFPSKHISIRGAREETYAVIDISKTSQSSNGSASILEEIETSRAMFEIYEGGVFMHQGQTFVVNELSHDSKLAKVTQVDINWTTSPRDFTNVDAVQTYRTRKIKNSGYCAYYGKVEVVVKVFGFFKIRNRTILDAVDLDTSPWERETTGLWMDVPKALLELFGVKGINASEAIHAAQHAFLNHFPLAEDIRTECKAPEKEYKAVESKRKRPARLIFYDSIGKGGGVAAKAFDNVYDILEKACKAIESCTCEAGCIKCVQSSACREGNVVCSKFGAQLVLKSLLGLEIKIDSIPFQGDRRREHVTIVEATPV